MEVRKKAQIIFAILAILSIGAGVFDYSPLWEKISKARSWSLGLDIAGGSLLTYEIDLQAVAPVDRDSVAKGLRDVIERRVNLFGVSEPRVYLEKSGENERLLVELAGVKEISEAIKMIGETPFLDFREVKEEPVTNKENTSTLALNNAYSFIPTELNGRYVKSAQLSIDPVSREPQVNIEFTSEGAEMFASLTEKNVGKPIAIFLDNQLIEMPTVREKIIGGKAQITGKFTLESARQLVERFNAGALPAPIILINQQTVSADFGQSSLQKSILAGMLGTLLVIVFMIVFYRWLGVVASVALLMYIALTLAIFKVIPITLTLAGIAGLILSIGMAVDANILVFERTKEEIAKGVSKNTAIEEGFKRAWASIRDSNVSTMITSAVLYYFTSSFVQGFALALFVGVIVSMISAITITRSMLRVFIK